MAGPKHLWSGDWERESAEAADQRPEFTPPEPEEPTDPWAAPRQRPRRRFTTRQLLTAAAAGLAAVLVGAALAETLGGSGKPHVKPNLPALQQSSTGPSGGSGLKTQPTATPVVTGPSAHWLGMQIVSSPEGAVVSTVPGGSAGDIAGFEPGDVISAIGNAAISSVREIPQAVANVPIGNRIQVTISRGSSIISTTVTLADRPTIQP
jgi:predicted metalloprotease with PDZ domain